MRSLSGGLFHLWLFTLKKSQSVLHFQQLSTHRAAPLHLASGDSRCRLRCEVLLCYSFVLHH